MPENLRDLAMEELVAEGARDLRGELFNAKVRKHATGTAREHGDVASTLRRDIARVETVLREKRGAQRSEESRHATNPGRDGSQRQDGQDRGRSGRATGPGPTLQEVRPPLLASSWRHDESNDCSVGDRVRIIEHRPLSKRKRWKVQNHRSSRRRRSRRGGT